MAVEKQGGDESMAAALADLTRLRQFTGTPAEFWPSYLAAASRLVDAELAVLLVRPAEGPGNWKKLSQWTSPASGERRGLGFIRLLPEIADSIRAEGFTSVAVDSDDRVAGSARAIGVRIPLTRSNEVCVAAFFLGTATETVAAERGVRLRLASDVPLSYLMSLAMQQARTDVDRFAQAVDLMADLNAATKFQAAVLGFCNGVATRHQCDRVSLGWVDHGYIRLQAMSRTEKFDRHMAAVKALESAMEESMDQDDEILWPKPEGAQTVSRDHEAYARTQGVAHVVSFPVRLDGVMIAVVTCERQGQPFLSTDIGQIRLACDQAARRLSDLYRTDRWWGARLAASAKERVSKWVGFEHTWRKLAAVLVAVGVVVLIVAPWHYRVEAKFLLHSDEVSYLTAPFEGFLRTVTVRTGEPVTNGQALVTLAKDQLELEESTAIADLTRFSREAEKSRAISALADMRIALALADQARARLELVRYRIEQSAIKSPFNGVVVEGDLREKIGAPVKQGDILFKVARTERLYIEADVDERDIHEIKVGVPVEVAFASQPKLKFKAKVERIRTAAQPKEGGNVFLVRCSLEGAPQDWWRPGMSGLVKIDVGRRQLLWVMTHRTIDYLRLWFWL